MECLVSFGGIGCTRGSLPQRDLDYWAQAALGRPGGQTVAGTGPCCAPDLLQARAGRPPDSQLEPRRGTQTRKPRRPRFSTVLQAPAPFLECSGVPGPLRSA